MSAERPSFHATVSEYEPHVGVAANGDDYVCLRGGIVTTPDGEQSERTVMAFGPPAAALARRLAEAGDAPMDLELIASGPVFKVAGEDAAVEARHAALSEMTLLGDAADVLAA